MPELGGPVRVSFLVDEDKSSAELSSVIVLKEDGRSETELERLPPVRDEGEGEEVVALLANGGLLPVLPVEPERGTPSPPVAVVTTTPLLTEPLRCFVLGRTPRGDEVDSNWSDPGADPGKDEVDPARLLDDKCIGVAEVDMGCSRKEDEPLVFANRDPSTSPSNASKWASSAKKFTD